MGLLNISYSNKRVFGLDIIRALAVFFVVLGHSLNLLPEKFKAFISLLPFPDGVSIFFVLSGFLIGKILIETIENKTASFETLLNFWKRRWLRTFPLYFLLLIMLSSLSLIFVPGFRFAAVLRYVFFLQNFNKPHPIFFIEAWSLSVEEWFYFLIPSMIFILVRAFKIKQQNAVLACIVGVITLTILTRYHRYLTISVDGEQMWGAYFRNQVITRLDGLMFGVLGAYISNYHSLLWTKYKTHCFIFGIFLIFLFHVFAIGIFRNSVFYFCNLSFVFTAISILLTLPFLSQLKSSKGFLYKVITYISLISYSLYLTHASLMMQWIITKIPVLQIGSRFALGVRYGLYWILSITIAFFLYNFIELPFLNLRERNLVTSEKIPTNID